MDVMRTFLSEVDGLDAGDVFGVLVADLALHPEAKRRAMLDRQCLAVHAIGEDGLRVKGVEQVDAFIIELALRHLVETVKDDIARFRRQPGHLQEVAERNASPLADRAPALVATVLGDLRARRQLPDLVERERKLFAHQAIDLEAPIGEL